MKRIFFLLFLACSSSYYVEASDTTTTTKKVGNKWRLLIFYPAQLKNIKMFASKYREVKNGKIYYYQLQNKSGTWINIRKLPFTFMERRLEELKLQRSSLLGVLLEHNRFFNNYLRRRNNNITGKMSIEHELERFDEYFANKLHFLAKLALANQKKKRTEKALRVKRPSLPTDEILTIQRNYANQRRTELLTTAKYIKSHQKKIQSRSQEPHKERRPHNKSNLTLFKQRSR